LFSDAASGAIKNFKYMPMGWHNYYGLMRESTKTEVAMDMT